MNTRQRALEDFRNDHLIALGKAADEVRKRLHPEELVSYGMERGAEVILEFQADEPLQQIVQQLEALRQRPFGSISAVMPRSAGTAMEYLKILALTRIYLDNVPHVQASWQAGLKLGQVALRFGADDINGAEPGKLRATEEDLRRIIRDAGYVPKQRDGRFRIMYLN